MPAAVLTPAQERVLRAVKSITPHATLAGLAIGLERPALQVQLSLDALIRRGFITPVEVYGHRGTAYIATTKGRNRV